MAMGPSIRELPAGKAVTSPFRYKSPEVYFIMFAFITSCGMAQVQRTYIHSGATRTTSLHASGTPEAVSRSNPEAGAPSGFGGGQPKVPKP